MPDGRLWLFRDTYATQTAWAPRHIGKELRLSRLGAFDAALGAIRADAEAQAARKTGGHDRAARHEHLAASYRAMRDHYQQQQQAFAQIMAAREECEVPRRPVPAAWPSPLTPSFAAATPVRRSSRFAPPSPHLSAIPSTSRPTLRPDQEISQTTAWAPDRAIK